MGDDITQEYFTLTQLAQYMGVSRPTLYRVLPALVKAGKIRAYKLDGLKGARFRRSEVDACFEVTEFGEDDTQ